MGGEGSGRNEIRKGREWEEIREAKRNTGGGKAENWLVGIVLRHINPSLVI